MTPTPLVPSPLAMGPLIAAVGFVHYALVSAVLLGVGLYLMTARRQLLVVLMGVELVLNAAALNFVAAGRYLHDPLTGQAAALLIIVLAAAEAALALAIMVAFTAAMGRSDLDAGDRLKG